MNTFTCDECDRSAPAEMRTHRALESTSVVQYPPGWQRHGFADFCARCVRRLHLSNAPGCTCDHCTYPDGYPRGGA